MYMYTQLYSNYNNCCRYSKYTVPSLFDRDPELIASNSVHVPGENWDTP